MTSTVSALVSDANHRLHPFEQRLRSHMDTYGWSRAASVGAEQEYRQRLHREGSGENNRRTAYIHIPFCGTLCTFCNFQRKPGTPAMADDYADLVMKELDWLRHSAYVRQGGFEALYVGGGTPSLLGAASLVRLLSEAKKVLRLEKTAEVTIESTVHDLSQEKLAAMAEIGVNRISLGVQTFETRSRRQLGRLSDRNTVCRMIETARAAGIETISADLLYRLPGQTTQGSLDDIRTAIELNLDGVSLYPLIAMEGTPLESSLETGRIPPLPNLDSELEQYYAARERLLEAGYAQDTCTHFAQSADKNLYSQVRLDDGDCLPIGCSAGGYMGPLVLMNAMNKQMYQSLISAGQPGHMASVRLPDRSRLLRSATGQIQRGYINPQTVFGHSSQNALELFQPKIDRYVKEGLLRPKGEEFRLTDSGWAWCYNLAAEFVNTGDDLHSAPAAYPIMSSPHKTAQSRKKALQSSMHGFTLRELSVLGVMCALVLIVQFVAAMLLHTMGIAVVPGLMQFAMAFVSCLILFIALRKVPKGGALSIMSAVYSLITMLTSGSLLMGMGLLIGGVTGDFAAKWTGGIRKTAPLVLALVIYRISQTSFSRLYAYFTDMTQVQFVWYLVIISIAASAVGALLGGLTGFKLSKIIRKAGVMS